MLIVLPQWTIELEEKLDKVIRDLAVKHHINLGMIDDSRAIKSGKDMISSSLVNLYEKYDVYTREALEEFDDDVKKAEKNLKRRKTSSVKIPRGKTSSSRIKR